MPYALVLMLMVAAAVMEYVGSALIPAQRATMQTAQAQWVVIYGQAAQSYLAAHPGYSGAITDAQMQTVLGTWSNLPAAMTQAGVQHGALVSSGRPYGWGLLPTGATAAAVGELIRRDLSASGNQSITVNQNGTLVNPQLSNPQPAPAGIPDNALVVAPQ